MAKVVIFGVQDFAQLASFYLRHDSEHEVVAFSVHEDFLPAGRTFEALPVVAFERVEETYDPSQYSFFAPLSQRRMGRLRESVYHQIKAKRYSLISYVSSRATVFPGVRIGENCFILEDNTIQPFVEIGNDVVLWSGNHIGHHCVIQDHVLFTSHVVLSGHCVVEPYSFLGVNATVRDQVRIAEGSLIGMAAAVTRDTEPWGVYKGNPATKGDRLSSELDF
jgi:sugar O-acyltransferase (sialic acid O-acetyltransferase NeuD family)